MSDNKRKKVYELGEATLSPSSGDPIDQTLKLDEELMVREYKTTRLQLATEKYKQELNTLKGASNTSSSASGGGMGVANPMSSLMMMLVSQGLDPIKANEYIKALDNESMMKLSVLGGQNSNALLPLIMLGSKQGTSIDDIVKVVGAIISMSKTGQGNGSDNAMLTKLVTETLPNLQRDLGLAKDNAWQFQLQNMQKQLDDSKPRNAIDVIKEVTDIATSLGLKPGGLDVETQRMLLEDKRAERELLSKREGDRETLGMVKDMIDGRGGDLIAMAGGAIKEKFMGGGGEARNPSSAPQRAEQPQVLTVRCSNCGEVFRASANAKAAMCPKCRTNLTIAMEPPVQEENEAESPQSIEQDPSRVASFAGEGDLKPVWSGPPPKE